MPRYSIRTLLLIFVVAAIAAVIVGSAVHGTGLALALAVMLGAAAGAILLQALAVGLVMALAKASNVVAPPGQTPAEPNVSALRRDASLELGE
ncbi:MAG: hypothetical protein QM811_20755 [Pirellulales bacterium]